LGHAAVAAGVARGRSRLRPGRAALVAAVAGRRADAAAGGRGGRRPGVPGEAARPARRGALPAGRRRPELRPALGPVVAAVADLALRLPAPEPGGARPGPRPARAAAAGRRADPGVLDRGVARPGGIAEPGGRLPDRTPLGPGDRLRVVGLGPGGVRGP